MTTIAGAITRTVRSLPDAAKRALRVALFAFAATFGLSLIGFLNDVQAWSASGGPFPSVAVLGKAALSAAAGAGAGLVAFVVNKLEDGGAIPALFGATKPDAKTKP